MSWYELNNNFNVRFGAYRRTSDSYGECYSPAARIPPSPIRLQPLSVSGAAGSRTSAVAAAMASAMAATMPEPGPLRQPFELRGPPATPAKPRRASIADAKLPEFKLSVDDLTRVAEEAGLPFWTRKKLQGLFALFDTDRDNAIERAEFEYVAKQLLQLIEPPKAQAAGHAEAALPEKLKAFQPLGKVAEVVVCVAPLQALDAALEQAVGGAGSSGSSGSAVEAVAERRLSEAKAALAAGIILTPTLALALALALTLALARARVRARARARALTPTPTLTLAKAALTAGIERAAPVMARVIKRRLAQSSVVLECLHVIAAGLDFFEGAHRPIEPYP